MVMYFLTIVDSSCSCILDGASYKSGLNHLTNEELEKKNLQVIFNKAKNAQFVQHLVEQHKFIIMLKRHVKGKEIYCFSHIHKVN
jgi:hypothetical protein